ncbi:putative RNA recognition motif domain, nucleotide-binding alpha-beta plait domain superfamily [Helianthus annuus]|nr:putative RNA recognition motif domain, nucleotide-binding alpha-beta plait domain superfamily [Helianthus annuus]
MNVGLLVREREKGKEKERGEPSRTDEEEEGEWGTMGMRRNFESREELCKEPAITFYVANIHPSVSDNELWIECMNVGLLVDAYIARKRDKKGVRFGFVRFVRVKDANKMIKALNRLNFYGWYIRANVARYDKDGRKTGDKHWVRKELPQVELSVDQDERKEFREVRQETSYMGILHGYPDGGKIGNNKWESTCFCPSI